jgi:hypothetical protein
MTTQGDSKKQVALAILEKGKLYIHLDPRRPGVAVPEHLTRQPQLVLLVARGGTPIPIEDLVVDDDGIRATLSFKRTPFACVIPWPAVFALVNDSQMGRVFEEDVPADLPRPPAHQEACSFCLTHRREVRYLVTGGNASICSSCIDQHRKPCPLDALARRLGLRSSETRGKLVTIPYRATMPYREATDLGCSFCGLATSFAIVGLRARICTACVGVAAKVRKLS